MRTSAKLAILALAVLLTQVPTGAVRAYALAAALNAKCEACHSEGRCSACFRAALEGRKCRACARAKAQALPWKTTAEAETKPKAMPCHAHKKVEHRAAAEPVRASRDDDARAPRISPLTCGAGQIDLATVITYKPAVLEAASADAPAASERAAPPPALRPATDFIAQIPHVPI